jgi:glycosyltransferase involved in cell wall biosynthesis
MAGLRIGINALYLIPGGVGGTEIYLRNLLPALAEIDVANEYVVFTNRETSSDLVPDQPNFRLAPQPIRASGRPIRILWEQSALPWAATKRHRLDVLFNPGFTAPIVSACRNVTVFHDLQHKRHPEHFRLRDLPFWRFFLYASAHRSRILLAVSEATRRDLLHYYRLAEEKIRVVPLGVHPRFFELGQQRAEQPEQPTFFLCVSTLHPHKNLDRLVRAYAEFRRSHPELRLVIAGMPGFHAKAIQALIAELKLGESVHLTGWIPREELQQLYLEAFAFIYPSTFEGFGLPVLEALAAGLPTACSSIEPLSSLAGRAALLFDPFDQDALLEAMLHLASAPDLRARLAKAGPRRAGMFSWTSTAQKTLKAIRDAAG